ncbi:MAG: hypothetical protein KF855_06075 [Acidobacteria bacterium]|nr:hypothetical protein [Acidobacteriota bacterium]
MSNIKLFILSLFLSVLAASSLVDASDKIVTDQLARSNQASDQKITYRFETPEQKAVRLAEEHIARNGYTKAEADRENLSFETVEFSGNVDEMLELRHDTLNPGAYGVVFGRSDSKKGWTIVFEYSDRIKAERAKESNDSSNKTLTGRAVTMNKDFKDLRVEHKAFILDNVDKVLD